MGQRRAASRRRFSTTIRSAVARSRSGFQRKDQPRKRPGVLIATKKNWEPPPLSLAPRSFHMTTSIGQRPLTTSRGDKLVRPNGFERGGSLFPPYSVQQRLAGDVCRHRASRSARMRRFSAISASRTGSTSSAASFSWAGPSALVGRSARLCAGWWGWGENPRGGCCEDKFVSSGWGQEWCEFGHAEQFFWVIFTFEMVLCLRRKFH